MSIKVNDNRITQKTIEVGFGDIVVHSGNYYTSRKIKGVTIFLGLANNMVWDSDGIHYVGERIPLEIVKEHFYDDEYLEYIPKENVEIIINIGGTK